MYIISIMVYFIVLAVSALSWLIVVSNTIGILLSAASAHFLGEDVNHADAGAIFCALGSTALVVFFQPDAQPNSVHLLGEKVFAGDIRTLSAMWIPVCVLLFLLWMIQSADKAVSRASAVLSYALASGLSQLQAKLLAIYAPACGFIPTLIESLSHEDCTHGILSPLVFFIPCACLGSTAVCLMVMGVDWFENKFWLPNALALDVASSGAIGLIICGEAEGMQWRQIIAICLSGTLAAVSLKLSSAQPDATERKRLSGELTTEKVSGTPLVENIQKDGSVPSESPQGASS